MVKKVIVRAMRGEPVRLVEIERGEKVVWVSSESALDRVNAGTTEPIGIPIQDVLPYDASVFQRMRSAWENNGLVDWAQFAAEIIELASRG